MMTAKKGGRKLPPLELKFHHFKTIKKADGL
jgi:hypothetical protein